MFKFYYYYTGELGLISYCEGRVIRSNVGIRFARSYYFWAMAYSMPGAVIDGPQPFTQFLVEIDDEFAQTVLLDIGDLFIHPILCLNRGLHVLKVPKIGLELGHLPANIALGEDELIILIRFLLGSLLVLLFFVNFLTVFGAAAREDGTEQLPFGLSCGRLELLVQLHELLEFGLNFADIQLFLHLNVA